MKITTGIVRKVTIRGVKNLDAINVYLEDFGPGQGRVTIECFGDSWSHYWSHMGEDNRLVEFLTECNVHYIAGKLAPSCSPRVNDESMDALKDAARKFIISERKNGCLGKSEAKDRWCTVTLINEDGIQAQADELAEIFGDDWHCELPMQANPKYEHLIRIIETVLAAFKSDGFVEDAIIGSVKGEVIALGDCLEYNDGCGGGYKDLPGIQVQIDSDQLASTSFPWKADVTVLIHAPRACPVGEGGEG